MRIQDYEPDHYQKLFQLLSLTVLMAIFQVDLG